MTKKITSAQRKTILSAMERGGNVPTTTDGKMLDRMRAAGLVEYWEAPNGTLQRLTFAAYQAVGAVETARQEAIDLATAQSTVNGQDLTKLGPVEFDTLQAQVEDAYGVALGRQASAADSLHRANGERGTARRWGTEWANPIADTIAQVEADPTRPVRGRIGVTAGDVLAQYRAAVEVTEQLSSDLVTMFAEYDSRPWPRYMITQGSNAHIHKDTRCSSCHKGRERTQFGWLIELSGKPVDECIDQFKATMCTVCFPNAPVIKVVDPDVCQGTIVEGSKRRAGQVRRGWSYVDTFAGDCSCGKTGVMVKDDGTPKKHKPATPPAAPTAQVEAPAPAPAKVLAAESPRRDEITARIPDAGADNQDDAGDQDDEQQFRARARRGTRRAHGWAGEGIWFGKIKYADGQPALHGKFVTMRDGDKPRTTAVTFPNGDVVEYGVGVNFWFLRTDGTRNADARAFYVARMATAAKDEPAGLASVLGPDGCVAQGVTFEQLVELAGVDQAAARPMIDGDGVEVEGDITVSVETRLFFIGRVRGACGHYMAASERRAGLTTCERCPVDTGGHDDEPAAEDLCLENGHEEPNAAGACPRCGDDVDQDDAGDDQDAAPRPVAEPWASMVPDPHPAANCGPLQLELQPGDQCPTCGTVIAPATTPERITGEIAPRVWEIHERTIAAGFALVERIGLGDVADGERWRYRHEDGRTCFTDVGRDGALLDTTADTSGRVDIHSFTAVNQDGQRFTPFHVTDAQVARIVNELGAGGAAAAWARAYRDRTGRSPLDAVLGGMPPAAPVAAGPVWESGRPTFAELLERVQRAGVEAGELSADQAVRLLDEIAGGLEALAVQIREAAAAGVRLDDHGDADPADVDQAARFVRGLSATLAGDVALDERLAAADAEILGALQRQDDDDAAAVAGAVERQDDEVLTAALQAAGEPVGPAAAVDVPAQRPYATFGEQRAAYEAEHGPRVDGPAAAPHWSDGLRTRVVETWRVALSALMRSDGFVETAAAGESAPTLTHAAGVVVLVDVDGVEITYPDDNIADGEAGEGRGLIRMPWGTGYCTGYGAVRDVAAGLVMLVEAGKVVEPAGMVDREDPVPADGLDDAQHVTRITGPDSAGHWGYVCDAGKHERTGYDDPDQVVAAATAHGPLAADSPRPALLDNEPVSLPAGTDVEQATAAVREVRAQVEEQLERAGRGGLQVGELRVRLGGDLVGRLPVELGEVLRMMYADVVILASGLPVTDDVTVYAYAVPCGDCDGNGQNCLAHRTYAQRRGAGW